jgi:nucleotide-binding universal stress UspA family protein
MHTGERAERAERPGGEGTSPLRSGRRATDNDGMERIVVGVEESSGAADALRWAVRERQLRDGTLTAVLAWTYLGQHHGGGDDAFQPDYDVADAAQALDELLVKFAPDDAASIERRVVCDLPARALLEASAGADLLVVGSRGLGGFRGLLLGSVSQQCAEHSAVPVAVVRARPGAPLSEHVLVGVDGSANSQRALAWALAEARVRQAPLTVVHSWEPVVFPAFGMVSPYDDTELLRAAAEELVRGQVRKAVGDTDDVVIDVRVTPDRPADALLYLAKRATVVVVGSRGRGGFAPLLLGSVSHKLLHHAPCPVVVIPPEHGADGDG